MPFSTPRQALERSKTAAFPAMPLYAWTVNDDEAAARAEAGFEDAVQQGVARATKTLRNVRSAWIKEQRVDIRDGRIAEYQVNMMVTFILDD